MSTTTIESYGTSVTNVAVQNPINLVGMTFATPSDTFLVTMADNYQKLLSKVDILQKRVDDLETRVST